MKRKNKSPHITIGSVVVLKSGSLPMTVSQMDGNKICADYWDGEKINRYTGNRVMFKAVDTTISVQGAMKLVSQRRVQPVRPVSRSN